jgi:hypothetical protein
VDIGMGLAGGLFFQIGVGMHFIEKDLMLFIKILYLSV